MSIQSNEVKISAKKYEILENTQLSNEIFQMKIKGDFNKEIKAGQFINIKVEDSFLRRPISVANIEKDYLQIIYKVVGKGTKRLSQYQKGEQLDILLPLGNGFELVKDKKVLLIGGGIGTPPLLELKKQLKENNDITLLVGLNNVNEDIYQGYRPITCTIDGSLGYQGNVLEYLQNNELDYDYVYMCGPVPMLKSLQEYFLQNNIPGELSIESRMGCGYGACMGCSCKTKTGASKRVCVEGPVFKIGELDFDEN